MYIFRNVSTHEVESCELTIFIKNVIFFVLITSFKKFSRVCVAHKAWYDTSVFCVESVEWLRFHKNHCSLVYCAICFNST